MNTPLSVSTSVFFFSYAHKDADKWLERFLTDLKDAVQRLGVENVNFHDLSNLEPGDDWEEEIAVALQCSLTMVCLYSPWYFKRDYCGKEFQVFLDRQRSIRMDEDGTVRGSEKIIPILWQPLKALARWGFPPEILRFIQHTIGDVSAEYEADGLYNILKNGRRRSYFKIVRRIAEQIVDRAIENPLPSLDEPPSLQRVRSAFAPAVSTGLAASGTTTPGGPDVLAAVYLTPSPWTKGPDQRSDASRSSGIAPLVDEVAMDQSVHCFHHWVSSDLALAGKQAVGILHEANRLNQLALLVLDLQVATRVHVELLRHILPSHHWYGGFLIIGGEEEDAWDLRSAVRTIAVGPEKVLIKELAGPPGSVRAELASFLTELRRRVVATGPVQQPLIHDGGPQRRPLLAGPREDLSNAAA